MQFVYTLMMAVVSRAQRDEDDVMLIGRIGAGDESALSELYNRYSQLLYAMQMRILHSVEDAEDMLQEVFLQVWNKASSYQRDKGTVYTWLVTLTRNRTIDRLRSKGFRKQQQEIDMEQLSLMDETRSGNPHNMTVLSEQQRTVVNVLQQLNNEQQQVLALAYYEGYSQSEIAEKLNVPLGTVKSRMRQGLLKMRSVLKEKM